MREGEGWAPRKHMPSTKNRKSVQSPLCMGPIPEAEANGHRWPWAPAPPDSESLRWQHRSPPTTMGTTATRSCSSLDDKGLRQWLGGGELISSQHSLITPAAGCCWLVTKAKPLESSVLLYLPWWKGRGPLRPPGARVTTQKRDGLQRSPTPSCSWPTPLHPAWAALQDLLVGPDLTPVEYREGWDVSRALGLWSLFHCLETLRYSLAFLRSQDPIYGGQQEGGPGIKESSLSSNIGFFIY